MLMYMKLFFVVVAAVTIVFVPGCLDCTALQLCFESFMYNISECTCDSLLCRIIQSNVVNLLIQLDSF